MSLTFSPGETNVYKDKFSPSVLMFWLKAELGVSSTRFVAKKPNTLLGLIPLGNDDVAYPLTNIAGVGVNTKFSVGRLIFGLLFLIIGLTLIDDNIVAVLPLLLGLSMLANCMSASLDITNNGGGKHHLEVSILEKSKLEAMREQVNARLFADHGRLRHEESMNVQQQQLNAQVYGNQLAQQQFMHNQQQQQQWQHWPQQPPQQIPPGQQNPPIQAQPTHIEAEPTQPAGYEQTQPLADGQQEQHGGQQLPPGEQGTGQPDQPQA